MAEKGAHLTGIIKISPSIFEVISQENFASALHPALFHVVKYFSEKNPERFGWIYRKYDELFLVLDTLIQYHYHLTRGGRISETFYGLERKLIKNGKSLPIKTKIFYISILSSVLVPYIRGKLNKKFQQLEADDDPFARSNNEALNEWQKKLLKFFPYFKAISDSLSIIYYLLYAFGKIKVHSLLLHILGIKLDYISGEKAQYADQKKGEIFNLESWKDFRTMPKMIIRSIGESILFSIEIGSFFSQFLEWWNSSEKRVISLNSLPIPEPYISDLSLNKEKCPLCGQIRKNSTALMTSGIVYCYTCISRHLKFEKKCPVTKYPSDVHHLIKIYI